MVLTSCFYKIKFTQSANSYHPRATRLNAVVWIIITLSLDLIYYILPANKKTKMTCVLFILFNSITHSIGIYLICQFLCLGWASYNFKATVIQVR